MTLNVSFSMEMSIFLYYKEQPSNYLQYYYRCLCVGNCFVVPFYVCVSCLLINTDPKGAHKYPSSSHYTRNWDKLVTEIKKEEKDEKPEGNEAMNKLLQQIYGDGSDEVRKAMNKSFVSSVLVDITTGMY